MAWGDKADRELPHGPRYTEGAMSPISFLGPGSKVDTSSVTVRTHNFTITSGMNGVVVVKCLVCEKAASARKGPVRFDLLISDMGAHTVRCENANRSL